MPCMLGTQCLDAGVTRRTLPLLRGWWRHNSSSAEVLQCPDGARDDSGCTGGTGSPCKEHLQGPYCKLCNNSDVTRFYDSDVSECPTCSEKLVERMAPTWTAVASAILLLLATPHFGPRLARSARRAFPRLLTKWVPIRDKIRIMWGSFQIIYQVPIIYQLSLPRSVARLLEAIAPGINLGFDVLTTIPLECIGVGGFRPELVVHLLLPLVVLGFAYPLVVSTGHKKTKRVSRLGRGDRGSRASQAQQVVGHHFRQGLPLALFISFLAFPIVSTKAFQAFPSEQVGDVAYMKADYRVTSGSPKHREIKNWAYLAILLYPLGIPSLYGYLLYKVRHTLLHGERSPLSSSLVFLHEPFRAQFFWWELVLVAEKLILVGFFVLDPFWPGSFVQLLMGMAVAFMFMTIQMQVQPYRSKQDNLLATVCSVSVFSFFMGAALFRFHELTNDFQTVSDQLRTRWAEKRFTFSIDLISFMMVISLFGSLTTLVLLEILAPKYADFFRWEMDGSPVVPPALAADQFHTFLSHNWATGQVRERALLNRGDAFHRHQTDLTLRSS